MKKLKPGVRKVNCLLRLQQQKLSKGNLKDYQTDLHNNLSQIYNGILVIIKTNFGKEIAFFSEF